MSHQTGLAAVLMIARSFCLAFLSLVVTCVTPGHSCCPPGTIRLVSATDMDFSCIPQILRRQILLDSDLLCHQLIYRLARIKNYVLGTPSPNISLLLKIVWRKDLMDLHAEENFHHERAKHMTIYELQKQLGYHMEDIS